MTKILSAILLMFVMAMSTLARTTEKLEISEGNHKTADRGRVTVKFVSIIEDSRCPMNTTCVWAGNARIQLAVSKGKAAPKFIELNTNLDPKSAKVYGYEIKLESMTQKNPESMAMMDRPLVVTISVKK